MATYYIKNGGNDSLSGVSDAKAWATIGKAMSLAQSETGHTFYLKCGSEWVINLTDKWTSLKAFNLYAYGYAGTEDFPTIVSEAITGYAMLTPISGAETFIFRDIKFKHVGNASVGGFAFVYNMKALFYACVFVASGGSDHAVLALNLKSGSLLTNCVAYNGAEGVVLGTQGSIYAINNIIFTGFTYFISSTSGSIINFSYNCIFDIISIHAGAGTYNEDHTINAEPLFTSELLEDFTLQVGSPCIDSGDPSIYDRVDGSRSDRGVWGGTYMLAAPTIDTFTVSPKIATVNQVITITWATTFVDDGDVDISGIGSELAADGMATSSPSVGATTYTISLINGGIITGTVSVYVLPAIDSDGIIGSLLDTPTTKQYVYQIDNDAWTEFTNMDVLAAEPLTGGTETENVVLILNSNREIKSYPGTGYTSELTEFRTKRFYLLKQYLGRFHFDYEGSPDVGAIVLNEYFPSPYYKVHYFASLEQNKWRFIGNDKRRARSMEITLIDAELIRSIIFESEGI